MVDIRIPARDQLNAKRPRIDLFEQRRLAAAAARDAAASGAVAGERCAPPSVTPSSGAAVPLPPDAQPPALVATCLPPTAPASGVDPPARLFPPPADAPPHPAPLPTSASGSGSQPLLPPPISQKILVSRKQQGNRVLDSIVNVGWEWAHIVPDFQLGQSTVALFLSLRYHLLHPNYILARVEELHRAFTLCIILVLVDTENHQPPIQQITRAMLPNRCTVVLAFSNQEAARYLETFKAYQAKPADMLQQRSTGDYTSALNEVLSAIRAINKSDVLTLSTSVGSLREILLASEEQLALCPGLGEKKIRLLQSAVTDPFIIPVQAARRAPAPGPSPSVGAVVAREPTGDGATSAMPAAGARGALGV
ncbi:hypothetical protein KFE25_009324 [Diacronema lutheri]|uniref:ERCC1-like central domain-containing protein n=1 Tax=Diacronema lutheri TaxID=2081491 RepID=A0A8J6CKB7_DIALT|nr:hypothetical protein KFE25_009324 [Diacronema lutheri]